MKYEKMTTFTLFCLVLTSVVGLGGGMIFIWLSLIEGWNFLCYIVGFIMVICGMFTIPILFDYSAWKEDKVYGV
jgi:membrane protein YdbS with pleckstrin-like domain